MKQLLVLSGKGGTGKTTVASALIKLSGAKIFADCDVDAPNLHLVMNRTDGEEKTDFSGLPKAVIDVEKCIRCGKCSEVCQFDAVEKTPDGVKIDVFACEGCGVCVVMCPQDAITMEEAKAGELMLYQEETVFSTAKLKMGSGTSGKLVTAVKRQITGTSVQTDLAIIDGSPGIGCPVIASVSGVDFVLIVAEPSISGISDMERIIATAMQFRIPVAVCVNKYDTNQKNTENIITFCQKNQIPFAGKIPFDTEAVQAINLGISIVEMDCASGEAVKIVFDNIKQWMEQN